MRRLSALLVSLALLWLPASAQALVAYNPFGHTCSVQNGVNFCPTNNDSQRVPSFDGVPLDVDVTIPIGGGAPPFPTIVMLHGFPGSKKDFEATTPAGSPKANQTYHWNNNYFAKHGYVVVNYSARGFGRSCGAKDSRTKPACNKGWFHFADQRYEVHDTQYLLGKLVDEGLVDPTHLGVTGTSYGGGQAMDLAFLRNRIRTTTGGLIPWKSPGGSPLHISAAWPRWGWSDFVDAAAPNGRFLDYKTPGATASAHPIGLPKASVLNRLYLGGVLLAYLSPPGADPSADLKTWKDKLLKGEPFGSDVKALGTQFLKFKSALGLGTSASPLLVMNGWTDPIFPATEAVRTYNYLRGHNKSAPVSLQLADVGHFRAGNAAGTYRVLNDQGSAFFDHYLKGLAGGPAPGALTALGQGCPKGKVSPGATTVSSYSKFALGDVHLTTGGAHSLGPGGKNHALGKDLDPVTHSDPCETFKAKPGTDSIVLSRKSPGFTVAGATTISAKAQNNKKFGQIDARVWDVSKGKRRLIDRGTYRLNKSQKGKIVFQTFGNEYTVAKGHTLEVELVGHDSPMFVADKSFKVEISKLAADVPTRNKPNAKRGIVKPPKRS